VINAGGAFSVDIRLMDSSSAPPMIAPSQGIHLVVDKEYLGGDDAIMIPKTKDGRVLFAIPWLGRAILGTTDTAVPSAELEPKPLEDEVTYLLEHFGQYFSRPLRREDVLSVYAGLRPLVKPKQEAGTTSKISREHRIVTSAGGLLSILGGKWTTFRKMAEDVIDAAEQAASLTSRPPRTREMKIEAGIGTEEEFPGSAPTREQVVQAIRHEFARTVEDVLARRFRLLLTDARKSSDAAPEVARAMAEELGQGAEWEAEQIRVFQTLTKQYQI